jgi:hypothetical protein
MPSSPRTLRDVRASRPAKPYLPDGTLDPREWEIACSAAAVLILVVLRDKPWFVPAKSIEALGRGVEMDIRWTSCSTEKPRGSTWSIDRPEVPPYCFPSHSRTPIPGRPGQRSDCCKAGASSCQGASSSAERIRAGATGGSLVGRPT